MLSPIQQAAGLGNPSEPLYTNEIEGINCIIKRKVAYITLEWPEFWQLAKELIDEQKTEIEKAVVGGGGGTDFVMNLNTSTFLLLSGHLSKRKVFAKIGKTIATRSKSVTFFQDTRFK